MSEKEAFPCTDPVEPTATDNLGIRTQSPLLAKTLGAKFPPPPPKPPQDPGPHRNPEHRDNPGLPW